MNWKHLKKVYKNELDILLPTLGIYGGQKTE